MTRLITTITLAAMGFGLTGCTDYDGAVATHETYCEMVGHWNDESARGVPALDRTGWPPYDGECDDNR